jgi:uncharacterized damage-inducible protein DinB
MNKQSHLMMWDQQRMRHGITLRLIEQLPADKLTSQPIAGMRTPVELLVHMYMGGEAFAGSVLKGTLAEWDEKSVVASITTREQLLAFVNKTWSAIDASANAATDAQISSIVSTPWGEFPGVAIYGILYDEYLHHRGQLYAYVRALGSEPVMMWDFDHNATEFRTKQHAQG